MKNTNPMMKIAAAADLSVEVHRINSRLCELLRDAQGLHRMMLEHCQRLEEASLTRQEENSANLEGSESVAQRATESCHQSALAQRRARTELLAATEHHALAEQCRQEWCQELAEAQDEMRQALDHLVAAERHLAWAESELAAAESALSSCYNRRSEDDDDYHSCNSEESRVDDAGAVVRRAESEVRQAQAWVSQCRERIEHAQHKINVAGRALKYASTAMDHAADAEGAADCASEFACQAGKVAQQALEFTAEQESQTNELDRLARDSRKNIEDADVLHRRTQAAGDSMVDSLLRGLLAMNDEIESLRMTLQNQPCADPLQVSETDERGKVSDWR